MCRSVCWVFWREGLEVWRCSFQGRPVTLPTASDQRRLFGEPEPSIQPFVFLAFSRIFSAPSSSSSFFFEVKASFVPPLLFNPSAIFFPLQKRAFLHGRERDPASAAAPGTVSSSCISGKVPPDGQALLQFWKDLPDPEFFFLGCRKKIEIGKPKPCREPFLLAGQCYPDVPLGN